MGSISHHITPLVIDNLGTRHTTKACILTFADKAMLRNQAYTWCKKSLSGSSDLALTQMYNSLLLLISDPLQDTLLKYNYIPYSTKFWQGKTLVNSVNQMSFANVLPSPISVKTFWFSFLSCHICVLVWRCWSSFNLWKRSLTCQIQW